MRLDAASAAVQRLRARRYRDSGLLLSRTLHEIIDDHRRYSGQFSGHRYAVGSNRPEHGIHNDRQSNIRHVISLGAKNIPSGGLARRRQPLNPKSVLFV
jgi:hypothetical protein